MSSQDETTVERGRMVLDQAVRRAGGEGAILSLEQVEAVRVALAAVPEQGGELAERILAWIADQRKAWQGRDGYSADYLEARWAALSGFASVVDMIARDLSLPASPAKGEGDGGRVCGRLLIGEGTDTWDPVCQGEPGHAGRCEPSDEDKEAVRRHYKRGVDHG